MDSQQTKIYRQLLRRIEDAKLSHAIELDVSDLRLEFLTALPKEISELPSLRSLTINSRKNPRGYYQIADLGPLAKLTALQSLDISGCRQIADLRPLAKLMALQSLNVSWCKQIADLSPLAKLTALQSLNVFYCVQIADLSPLAELTALQSLNVSHCVQIADLSPLAKLTALQSLSVSYCLQIADLGSLAELTALQSLDLSWCGHIADLSPLAKLTVLQSLDASGCEQIADLGPLAKLTALQSLNVSYCGQIADLRPLAELMALQSLNVSYCGHIADLSPLAELTALQSLNVSYCGHIADLSPLAKLTVLQSLDAFSCGHIADLRPLAKLTALQSLDLSWCTQMADLSPLAKLTALQSLNVSYCGQIADLRPLAKLTALQSLNVSHCGQIADLRPLAKLTALQSLDLSRCEQIADLRPLAKLTALQSLNVSHCGQIADLSPLAEPTALQSLNVSWCSHIPDLSPLAKLTALQSLNVSYCRHIADLRPLAKLTALQSLDLSRCEQIADLRPLAKLTALQSLDLSRCEQIADLRPLAKLTALQSLNVSGCEQIDDLRLLAELTALQSLNVAGCEQIDDLRPLAKLTALQSLSVSGCEQIADLRPLAKLTALQSLNVSGCEQIDDLRLLAELTALQSLNVAGCEQIDDLRPLAKLTALQSLSVSGCEQIADLSPLAELTALQSLNVSECGQTADLRPLAKLTALQSLDLSWCTQMADLSPLAKLTALQSLDLSRCTQMADLSPLAKLTALQSLNVSRCEQIADLRPLAKLTALQSLNVSGLPQAGAFSPLLGLLPHLSNLFVYGSQWTDLPAEVCGDSKYQSALESVRAHFADLAAGSHPDVEVKILLLGNGGAGKSQLCLRLRGFEFDPTLPTTHGIQVHQKTMAIERLSDSVVLNFWDFGGQEIYHGSHSLFLQGQAVFLLLWVPEKERAAAYQEHGVTMRHRPVSYWLDYLRSFAGTKLPLLLIQSQCDGLTQRVAPPLDLNTLQELTPLPALYVSAKNGNGLELVKAGLKDAVRYALEVRPAAPIGKGRAVVRDRLRQWLAADQVLPPRERQHRWLERSDFDALCEEIGGISSTDALLDFLHHGGPIFYRPNAFSGRIILDQNWALEAIYTLFDRTRVYPLLRRAQGRFSRADLELLAWAAYSREEQLIFLGMMESCGISFKTRKLEGGDWEYIAPELLPAQSEAQETLLAGRVLNDPPTEEARAEYEFLHEGVLRNFLSKIGAQAQANAIYWRYGCWFYEKNTDSRVLIDSFWRDAESESGPGTIRLQGWGQRARDLLEPLVTALDSLPAKTAHHVNWTSSRAGGRTFEEAGDLEGLNIATAVQPAAQKPSVFVSYARGGDSGAVVEQMCSELGKDGWNVVHDKSEMRNGQLISDFMTRLCASDRIIVVLNNDYLHSEYCMAELHGVYLRCRSEQKEFLEKIVPLTLEDARYSGWRERTAIAKHWRTEFEEMQANVQDIAEADLHRYKAIRDWHNRAGDVLAYVADVLHPHGIEKIVEGNFAGLKRMLSDKAPG